MTQKEIERTEIEAPYELPEGWKWCRLGDVAKFIGGGTPDKSNSSYWNGKIPWASVKDIKGDFLFSTEDFITELGLHESSASLCDENGLILVTRISPGKSIISKIKTAINQDLKIIETEEFKPFLKYFFDFYEEEIKLLSSGTTVKGIKLDVLNSLPFPLPPTLAEQQRIVSRIESLFTKLDEARDKAQSMVDGFELRRAAVLHKAFTGELTAKWRKENGVSDDSWEEKLFDSCIAKMQNGISKRSGSEGEETVVLRLANIGENDFDVSDLRTIKLTSKEQDNYSLTRDDVVMIRVNGSKTNVGRQILVKNNNGWSFCDHIIRIKYETFCMPSYMVYFSHTKEYKDYVQDNMVSSAGQNTISRKGLSNLTLKIPSLPEQQEIVRILDSVLEKESRAKEATQTVLDQIALLKKSILARAFRGEL